MAKQTIKQTKYGEDEFIDSTTASVIAKVVPSWLPEAFTTALFAGIVGFLLWFLQYCYAKRQAAKHDRERNAKVWALALIELREAISRSLSYLERFNKGVVSLGVLYFSKTVASDYFKSYSDLSVATDVHWMYALLNQVQENLQTSKVTDEITRHKNNNYPMFYAGAAAGFVETHKDALISKFNSCLREWHNFCKKHGIEMDIELEIIEQSDDATQKTD